MNNVAKDNDLSQKAVRDLMDYAIKTAQVSLDITTAVLNKLIQNQQRKAYEAGGSSVSHHKNLINDRIKYLLAGYTNAEVNTIATDIANNPCYSISHFTKKYDIETDILTKMILRKAIVENISSDEIMEKLIERSLKGNNTEKIRERFESLRKKRKENKEKNS